MVFGIVFVFNNYLISKDIDSLTDYSSRNLFEDFSENYFDEQFLASVKGQDSRTALVEKYLEENNSPMLGSAKTFIQAAKKYNLDWKLLPAIAYTESTLGTKTPFGAYNAFGWGLIGNTSKGSDFKSWEEAIFTVAQGLRADYYNQGLTTLESINSQYAGDKNWHIKVKRAMSDLTN